MITNESKGQAPQFPYRTVDASKCLMSHAQCARQKDRYPYIEVFLSRIKPHLGY